MYVLLHCLVEKAIHSAWKPTAKGCRETKRRCVKQQILTLKMAEVTLV